MKFKGFVCALIATLLAMSVGGAAYADAASVLKGRNIRVVIGSTSVTADTYLTADLVCRGISDKYGCNMKVDPIGAGRALQEIVSTRPNGNTVMMFHDMTYLGVLYGAYKAEDYKLENMVVGGTYAYNPGDCFAATASAPFKNFKEMAEYMKANPDVTVRLAVEAGGVSQLGFDGIYVWLRESYGEDVASRLKAFVTGSTQEKLQALWDGNCQGIYAPFSALKEYTGEEVDIQLRVNILGLMAPVRIDGEPWPTFAEQGISLDGQPFGFTKEYFIFYPKGIAGDFVAAMDEAMSAVCQSDEYKAAVEKLGYKPQYMGSKDAENHIYEKRENYRKIIEKAPNFDDLVG